MLTSKESVLNVRRGYVFGFNGQEKTNEIAGVGNHYTAEFWEYDPRRAGRWNIDPAYAMKPWISPYHAFSNNPISKVDPNGAVDDWVQDNKSGDVSWDKDANSQATTKEGQTYLGKDLNFDFTSYIDKESWDVPSYQSLGMDATGDKLISNITVTGNENSNGELVSLSATMKTRPGSTPIGNARMFYPGAGGNNNNFGLTTTSTGASMNFEQHASVSPFEEYGLNLNGYRTVDVAQKLNISYNSSTTKLSISSYTDIFPSATLKMNGNTIMQYNQPSFIKTHTAPVNVVPAGRWFIHQPDFSYYPSLLFKR